MKQKTHEGEKRVPALKSKTMLHNAAFLKLLTLHHSVKEKNLENIRNPSNHRNYLKMYKLFT